MNYDFTSGEVDSIYLWFSGRLSGETISATKWTWYIPAGFTAIVSSTASGSTGMHLKMSATGAPQLVATGSAEIFTTGSARKLIDRFTLRITN